jgi:hypothetical protein
MSGLVSRCARGSHIADEHARANELSAEFAEQACGFIRIL